MTTTRESTLPDADMQAVPKALARAAKRAREIARQTGTAVVVVRDGKRVEERVGPNEGDGVDSIRAS